MSENKKWFLIGLCGFLICTAIFFLNLFVFPREPFGLINMLCEVVGVIGTFIFGLMMFVHTGNWGNTSTDANSEFIPPRKDPES